MNSFCALCEFASTPLAAVETATHSALGPCVLERKQTSEIGKKCIRVCFQLKLRSGQQVEVSRGGVPLLDDSVGELSEATPTWSSRHEIMEAIREGMCTSRDGGGLWHVLCRCGALLRQKLSQLGSVRESQSEFIRVSSKGRAHHRHKRKTTSKSLA
jgi:hypothetical protein